MILQISTTPLPGLLCLEPGIHIDGRGFFYESFNARDFAQATGLNWSFVQDNHAKSVRGVLRGLHYQAKHPQDKVVRVVAGEVFDVAVDIRKGSPTFGKWYGAQLSAENRRQMVIPAGFAHGYLALSDSAELLYKTTDYWYPECERSIRWNDPGIGIEWPGPSMPVMAQRDQDAPLLRDIAFD